VYFITYDIWKHGKMLHRIPDILDMINNKKEQYINYVRDYFDTSG